MLNKIIAVLFLFTSLPGIASAALPKLDFKGAIFLDDNGNDSRSAMNSQNYPWSTIGRLTMENGDGTENICTATLVGRSVVLTAAHCVLDDNGEIQHVEFKAAYVNGSYSVRAGSNWISVGTTNPDRNLAGDWAVIQLDEPLGDSQGWMGTQSIDSTPFDVRYAGYSDNFRDTEVAGLDTCSIRESLSRGIFGHNCSSGPGGSGGPLFFVDSSGGANVVAINTRGVHGGIFQTYGSSVANVAVMTPDLIRKVAEYREKFDR